MYSSNVAKSFSPTALFTSLASYSYCFSSFCDKSDINKCVRKKHSVTKLGEDCSKDTVFVTPVVNGSLLSLFAVTHS